MSEETGTEATPTEAAEAKPAPVVVDPTLQNFDPATGKSFHRIELWVETERTDRPSQWQWDSLLNPYKTQVNSINKLSLADARKAGFVDPTAEPECSLCFDRHYVLYDIDEQALELAQAYCNYVEAGWRVELCPQCGDDYTKQVGPLMAITVAQRNCANDYAEESTKLHRENGEGYQYRCWPVPNSASYDYSNFLPENCVPVNLLRGGDHGYYPEAHGSSDRESLRLRWRKKWKVQAEPPVQDKSRRRLYKNSSISGW